jgi:hypothetical protein
MLRAFHIWLRLRVADCNYFIRKLVGRAVRKIVEIAVSDLDLMAAVCDVASSVTFEREHLGDAARFKSRGQLHGFVMLELPGKTGLFLEFGVYQGDSINRFAAMVPDVHWHGFDSFVGLPEAWTPGAKKGAFDLGGVAPPVRSNVTLIKGFFTETLPSSAAAHSGERVVFLHVDCDLYSATKTVFDELENMLFEGSIILFDEYFNYPGWQNGEHKAFQEFIARKNCAFDYIGYVRTGSQVAVRLGPRQPLSAPHL